MAWGWSGAPVQYCSTSKADRGKGVEKLSSVALIFQVFSTIQGKLKAKHFSEFCSEALQSL